MWSVNYVFTCPLLKNNHKFCFNIKHKSVNLPINHFNKLVNKIKKIKTISTRKNRIKNTCYVAFASPFNSLSSLFTTLQTGFLRSNYAQSKIIRNLLKYFPIMLQIQNY